MANEQNIDDVLALLEQGETVSSNTIAKFYKDSKFFNNPSMTDDYANKLIDALEQIEPDYEGAETLKALGMDNHGDANKIINTLLKMGTDYSYNALPYVAINNPSITEDVLDIVAQSECPYKERLILEIANYRTGFANKAINILKADPENIEDITLLGTNHEGVSSIALEALQEIGTDDAIMGMTDIARKFPQHVGETITVGLDKGFFQKDPESSKTLLSSMVDSFSRVVQNDQVSGMVVSQLLPRFKRDVAEKLISPFERAYVEAVLDKPVYRKAERAVQRLMGYNAS